MSFRERVRQWVDWLFGYDFFVSYAHADGPEYPMQLAARLEKSGFRVFLDTRIYVAGEDLRAATRRHVRMSRKLVVVLRPHSLESVWVARELEACLGAGRSPVTVSINGALEKALPGNTTADLLRDHLFVREDLARVPDGSPSDKTVQDLVRSFDSTRQETLRLRALAATALAFAAIAVIALYQYQAAESQRQIAENRRKEVERQAQIGRSRELAALARTLTIDDPEQGSLVAIEALQVAHTAEAERALREALPQVYLHATLRGHSGLVTAARYLNDESAIVTAGHDGTIRIWDAQDGHLQRIITAGEAPMFTDVDVSPQGSQLVATGSGRVWIADLATGEFHKQQDDGEGMSFWARFTRDGSRIVTQRGDLTTSARETATGALVPGWPQGKSFLTPDRRWLVDMKDERTLRILDPSSGEMVCSTSVPPGALVWGGVSADARLMVVTEDPDGRITVWDSVENKSLRTWVAPGARISAAAFSPEQDRLATGGEDFLGRIWNLRRNDPPLILRGHRDGVAEIAFSPDGKWVATASRDQTARIWDALSGRPVAELRGHGGPVGNLAFHRDEARLLSVGWDTARVWDVTADRTATRFFQREEQTRQATLSPNGAILVSIGVDRSLSIWSARSGIRYGSVHHEGALALTTAFFPDGNHLAIAGLDHKVSIFELATRRLERHLAGHTDGVACLAVWPAGPLLASGGPDRTICVWREDATQPEQVLTGHEDAVRALTFLHGSPRLASASRDGSIRLWDIRTGDAHVFHQGRPVIHLSVSHDDRYLVGAGDDSEALVWNLESQQCVATLSEPLGLAGAVFHPTHPLIVTAGGDNVLRVWRIPEGTLAATMPVHSPPLQQIGISADGRWILTVEHDDAIYLYPWEMAAPLEELQAIAQDRLRRSLTPEERRRFLHRLGTPTIRPND